MLLFLRVEESSHAIEEALKDQFPVSAESELREECTCDKGSLVVLSF